MTERLTDLLLSPGLRPAIAFENYAQIYRKIEQSNVLTYLTSVRLSPFNIKYDDIRRAYRVNSSVALQSKRTLGECLIALIDRCDEEIYKGLSECPSDERVNLFLIRSLFAFKRVRRVLYPASKGNAEKIIQLVTSELERKFEPETHGRILASIMSPDGFFSASDNSLVRLFYEHYCANETLRSRVRSYTMLTNNRYDFVDPQLLASKLVGFVRPSFRNESSDEHNLDCLEALTRLVLQDVNNEELIDQLGARALQLNVDSYRSLTNSKYRSLSNGQFRHIALANAYLLMPFCKLSDSPRAKVQRILADSLKAIKLAGRQPTIRFRHNSVNSRIQENGYLSNGIFLQHFAILDRSSADLVPLDGYAPYFDKVESLPLTDQQQL